MSHSPSGRRHTLNMRRLRVAGCWSSTPRNLRRRRRTTSFAPDHNPRKRQGSPNCEALSNPMSTSWHCGSSGPDCVTRPGGRGGQGRLGARPLATGAGGQRERARHLSVTTVGVHGQPAPRRGVRLLRLPCPRQGGADGEPGRPRGSYKPFLHHVTAGRPIPTRPVNLAPRRQARSRVALARCRVAEGSTARYSAGGVGGLLTFVVSSASMTCSRLSATWRWLAASQVLPACPRNRY